jgi:hypothetical protein
MNLESNINSVKWPILTKQQLELVLENDPSWYEDLADVKDSLEELENLNAIELLTSIFKYPNFLKHQNLNLSYQNLKESRATTKKYKELTKTNLLDMDLVENVFKSLTNNELIKPEFQQINLTKVDSSIKNEIVVLSENKPTSKHLVDSSIKNEIVVLSENKPTSKHLEEQINKKVLKLLTTDSNSSEQTDEFELNFKHINDFKQNLIQTEIYNTTNQSENIPYNYIELCDVVIKQIINKYKFSFPDDFLTNHENYKGSLRIGGEEKEGYLLHSRCIFKVDDLDPRVTTLFLHGYECTILCHHDGCKREKRYNGIVGEIRSTLACSLTNNKPHIFKPIKLSIIELYEELL